jgi:hypothetical protein
MRFLLARHRELIIRGAALVGVISVWMYVRFRRLAHARPTVTYGPMSSRDEQRQKNLAFIYHSDDTHCINTLLMRRLHFSSFVTFSELEVCLRISCTATLKNRLQCFFMLLVITKGLGASKFLSLDQLKPSVGTSKRSYMQ